MVWLPALVLLVLAWGTCPCFYANLLTGGTLGVEADGGDGCACACAEAGFTEDVGDLLLADAEPSTPPSDCPCIDTIGTMHELPQLEEPSDLTPPSSCIAQEIPELACPAEKLGDLAELASPGTDPGPELRSIVLLV